MASWQRGVLRLMGVSNHRATVVSISDPTPWYRRIVFHSPVFVAGLEVFPTLWLRLWVPNPGKGADAVSQRGYTVLEVDKAAGTFVLEFVLHETEGPAGDWARSAQVGEEREVALTPARPKLPAQLSRVILAGDVTALPAINSWIEALPATVAVEVWLEDSHADSSDLPQRVREGVSWTWLVPSGERGTALAAALRGKKSVDPGTYLWAAGEKSLIKAVRSAAKEIGLDKAHQFSQFYWIEGRDAG